MRAWIVAVLLLFVFSLGAGRQPPAKAPQPVPVQIKRILLINEAPAVLLVDKPEDQFMLVFIDFFMANAIRMGMEEPRLERPLTHDLIGIFLRQLGARVTKIVITGLKNNTYYALITLEVNGRIQEIDARPSDALAIAVRQKTPIFAAPGLLRAVTKPEGPEGEPALPPGDRKKPKAST